MTNIGDFYLKIFNFLEVKFSIYWNRHVFVMNNKDPDQCVQNRRFFGLALLTKDKAYMYLSA